MSESSSLDYDDEVIPVHSNYTTQEDSERVSVYRSHLAEYAAETIAVLCTKREEQWELFSHLQPGIVLFSFGNHQRICFSRRGDRLNYKFRTTGVNGRLSAYSFRCLWVVQSPVFQEVLTELSPILDKGNIYLTFAEPTDTFNIRVSWTNDPFVPPGEILVQTLIDYDIGTTGNKGIDNTPQVPTVSEATPTTTETTASTLDTVADDNRDSIGSGIFDLSSTEPILSGSSNHSSSSSSPNNSGVYLDSDQDFNIL